MASIDDLIGQNGVVMACEYSPEGKCANYRSRMDMSSEAANKAGEYIATVTMLFNTLAGAFTKESGMQWVPQKGWTYEGGDWTVVVSGNRAVFAETSKVDMGALMRMIEQKAERAVQPSL